PALRLGDTGRPGLRYWIYAGTIMRRRSDLRPNWRASTPPVCGTWALQSNSSKSAPATRRTCPATGPPTSYSRFLPSTLPGMGPPLSGPAAGLTGAALGFWLTAARRRSRVLVPFSAGVLLGVALFGLLPELVLEIGGLPSLTLFASGYGLLIAVNRY